MVSSGRVICLFSLSILGGYRLIKAQIRSILWAKWIRSLWKCGGRGIASNFPSSDEKGLAVVKCTEGSLPGCEGETGGEVIGGLHITWQIHNGPSIRKDPHVLGFIPLHSDHTPLFLKE
jgi:hypothetical protein